MASDSVILPSGNTIFDSNFNMALPLRPFFQYPFGFRIALHFLDDIAEDAHVFLAKPAEGFVAYEIMLGRIVIIRVGTAIRQKGAFFAHGSGFRDRFTQWI